MDHIVFHLKCKESDRDVILAWCSKLPFHAFSETAEGWEAHLEKTADLNAVIKQLEISTSHLPFTFTHQTILYQNWNATWEAGFQPITIGRFCAVRAPFHPAQNEVAHDLIISPRMALGTGHHATTYQMIAAMENLPLSGSSVLDYGCGTGVLAILAARCGATHVDAIDIEIEAYENTLENAAVNNVSLNEITHGTLENIPARTYQIILANINRNVILASLKALYQKTAKGGWLLVSGILEPDTRRVKTEALSAGFSHTNQTIRGEWSCLLFRKPN